MIPTSAEHQEEGAESRVVTDVFLKENAPSGRPPAGDAAGLATAFSEFIAASARLEGSYRHLQDEVAALRLELSVQNAALKQSHADNQRMHLYLEQIVDSMPCGVLVVNQDGWISMLNPESARMLSLESARLPVRLQDVSALSGIQLQAWYQGPSGGETSQELCLRGLRRSTWIELRARRLVAHHGEAGDTNQTIFILRDITAQRRDEQERIAGRKAMALAEMSTILAHEIRNPLASLELFAELIENDASRRDTWISNLRAGIRSLSATANNVLSFHSPGALQTAPVPLSTLIDKAVRFVQPVADQASVLLEWDGAINPGIVMGNDCALQQVVLNLVSNAIRHTPAGGKVTITMRPAPGSNSTLDGRIGQGDMVVELADTGCGIRPDQVQHIFEPGFSGSGDTSGLGLAVCRQIMKQHHGTISVLPSRGGGARFELRFPLLSVEVGAA